MGQTGAVSSARPGIVIVGAPDGLSPITELTIPATLVRAGALGHRDLVHVYRPQAPTVAFSTRDLRSPGIGVATRVAREAGFAAVTRSPGGRMVAYDDGAVVIDHLRALPGTTGRMSDFAENARAHVEVLRALGVSDLRVGEVEGEYCPGEFSVNVGGAFKVIGSAERITARGALFSTVVQVRMSDAVRDVLGNMSSALGYPLNTGSIAGLTDVVPGLEPDAVATAFAADYRSRLHLDDGVLPEPVVTHARAAETTPATDGPFHVDDWTRAHPLP